MTRDWCLRRLGSNSTPDYALQPHIPVITGGRSKECLLRFTGQAALSISRLHVEFHQLHSQPNDSKLYWQIKDPGSASGVFVNKHRIPKNNLIRLNDGDIIGVGGNFKEEDIWKSSTKPYLLKVVAPDEWGQEQFPNDNNEDNKVTPPQSNSGDSDESGDLLELLERNRKAKKKSLKKREIKKNVRIKKEPKENSPQKVHQTDLVKKIMNNPRVPKILLHRIKSPKSKTAKIKSHSYEISRWIQSDDETQSETGDTEDNENDDDDVQFVTNFSQNDIVIEISDDDNEELISSQLVETIKDEPLDSCSSSDNEQESILGKLIHTTDQVSDEDEEENEELLKTRKQLQKAKSIFDDEDDSEEEEEDEDSIPILDEDITKPEKIRSKVSGKRRLSDEDVRKILDADSDDDFEENKQVPVTAKRPRIEKDQMGSTIKKATTTTKTSNDSKQNLSPAEISKLLNTDDTSTKQAKLIDALPQPPRFAKRRGISETTVKEIQSRDMTLSTPSCSKWLSKKKPDKSPSLESKKDLKSPELCSDRIKTLRKEKLKNLAALKVKDHEKNTEEKEIADKPVSKQKTNVKRSEPKIFNFLQQGMDCKPKQKQRQPSNRVAEQKSLARISKHVTTVQVNEPMAVDNEAEGAIPQSKKSLRWKDHDGSPIQQIRIIPNENLGKKVSASAVKEWPGGLPIHMETPPLLSVQKIAPIYTINDIFQRIVNWSPQWLEEQKSQKLAPPVFDNNPLKLKTNVFASYKEYCHIFYPLAMVELWATIFKDFITDKNTSIYAMLIHRPQVIEHSKSIIKLTFISAITEDEKNSHVPTDGWLTNIRLRYKKPDGEVKAVPVLGYVDFSKMERLTEGHYQNQKELVLFTREDRMNPEHKKKLKYWIKLEILTKRIPEKALTDKALLISPISRIKPNLRLFAALQDVGAGSCHLFSRLLNPSLSPHSFYVRSGNEPPCYPDNMINLNGDQKRIMSACASMCTTNLATPQVAIIQGPPGTGKSTTVAAMVLQIIFRWRKMNNNPNCPLPRILITAPSNAAVDEIVKKLLACRQRLGKDDRFNMMRIGNLRAIHPEVQNISLEKLKEFNLKSANARGSTVQSLDLEIASRNQRIEELTKKISEINDGDELNLYHRQIKEEIYKRDTAKENRRAQVEHRPNGREVYQQMDELLFNADIIASTLNSSMNKTMENFFINRPVKNSRPFAICIMDEASQCVEPEALIPLRLRFNKLVMVGDPAQLGATVTSVQAKKKDYDVSLFARIFKNFEHQPNNPIQNLTCQYRMHSDIMTWPNRRFYGGKLRQGDQNRNFGLANYKVLNLEDTYEDVQGSSIWNYQEAKFVADLTEFIKEYLAGKKDQKSIGIITFYNSQKTEIIKALRKRNVPVGDELGKEHEYVTVRSVDGFQGSECDIIIISCVRSKNNDQRENQSSGIGFLADEQRLNVALTRARYAEYVVGNFSELKKNKTWREMMDNAKERNKFVYVKSRPSRHQLSRYLQSVELRRNVGCDQELSLISKKMEQMCVVRDTTN